MTTESTRELVDYYAGLLILQYAMKEKATATVKTVVTPTVMPQTSVQEISFSLPPTSGAFALAYDDVASASVNWNDDATAIQTKLRAIDAALAAIVVTGSIAAGLVVTLTDVTPPALLFTVSANTLLATATSVEITVEETDEILPIAVENGFNLIAGTDIAVGAQLDVLGKYAGVTRSGQGFSTVISLTDADFYIFIQIALALNVMGSSLSDIQNFLATYFPDQIFVFDYTNMHMSYLVDSSVGSQDLVQRLVAGGYLPKPMGVQLATTTYAPDVKNFFGFRTYDLPGFNVNPFNSYSDYQLDWPWLTYQNGVSL